jgi:hypothetical protein
MPLPVKFDPDTAFEPSMTAFDMPACLPTLPKSEILIEYALINGETHYLSRD